MVALVACAFASPVAAQFGGLKKKIKAKAAQEGVSKTAEAAPIAADEAAEAGAADAGGGIAVLTKEVVTQLVAGLKAGQAVRDAAAKEDTPYGRTRRAQLAYAVARPKCEAANKTFLGRVSQNPKLAEKYEAANDKMTAAMEKGDKKAAATYQDEAATIIDPSCTVKEPQEPEGSFYQTQREVDERAEKDELKTSGLSRRDLPVLKERTAAILEGATPPGGASPGEKSAVEARSAELKLLLGIHAQPAATADKPGAKPAAASQPQVSPAAASMSECMGKNAEKNKARIEKLEKRAEAAEEAEDMAAMMAISDTMSKLHMAGCQTH
jgi:hypothetical protein